MYSDENKCTKRRQSEAWKLGGRRITKVCLPWYNCDKGWWRHSAERNQEMSQQSMGGLFRPDEDLENTEHWSKHENQPVQDTGAASTTVWMQSLEDNQNRREEAQQIPVHVLKKDPKNTMATTSPKRDNI